MSFKEGAPRQLLSGLLNKRLGCKLVCAFCVNKSYISYDRYLRQLAEKQTMAKKESFWGLCVRVSVRFWLAGSTSPGNLSKPPGAQILIPLDV